MGYYGGFGLARELYLPIATAVNMPAAPVPVVAQPVVQQPVVVREVAAPTVAIVGKGGVVATALGAVGVISGAGLALIGLLARNSTAIAVGAGLAVVGGISMIAGAAPVTVLATTPAIPVATLPRMYGTQATPLGAQLGQASLDISLPWWVVLPIVLTPLAVLGLGTYLLMRKQKAA